MDNNVEFLSHVPIKEMVDYGWLERTKDKREQAKAALTFFGVVSSDKIPLVEEVAFRRSEVFATNPWALAAWLRKAELAAQNISVAIYDREKFVPALQQIKVHY